MRKLDIETVKAMELTAPGACEQDAIMLSRNLTKGLIFKGFNDRERAHIRANILALSADRLIPSLHSFFEDINFIQGPAECVKRLVSRSLKNYFTDANQNSQSCEFQVSASKFETRPGTPADRLDLGYRQTWIMAMREYRAIPSRGRKATGDRLAKAVTSANEKTLCKFGALAYRLGFESDQIRDLVQRSPDHEIARSALLEARNQNEYRYDSTAFDRYVEIMVQFFNTASEVPESASLTKDQDYSDELPKRCGIPILQHHETDRELLFIDNLHGRTEHRGVTSFFIRRSVYLAFFGLPASNGGKPNRSLFQEELTEQKESLVQETEQRAAQKAREAQEARKREQRAAQEAQEAQEAREAREIEAREIELRAAQEAQEAQEDREAREIEAREIELRAAQEAQEAQEDREAREREQRAAQEAQEKEHRAAQFQEAHDNLNQRIQDDAPVPETVPKSPRNDKISSRPLTETRNAVSTVDAKLATTKIQIKLMKKKDGKWEVADTILFHPSDRSDTFRWLSKYWRKSTSWELKNKINQKLTEKTWLEDIINDGTYTIYLHRTVEATEAAKTFTFGEAADLIAKTDSGGQKDGRAAKMFTFGETADLIAKTNSDGQEDGRVTKKGVRKTDYNACTCEVEITNLTDVFPASRPPQ
jgi:hypothetical protein